MKKIKIIFEKEISNMEYNQLESEIYKIIGIGKISNVTPSRKSSFPEPNGKIPNTINGIKVIGEISEEDYEKNEEKMKKVASKISNEFKIEYSDFNTK